MDTGASAADALATEGELLLRAVQLAPTAAVPGCPGWTSTDLLTHVAQVHRWAAGFLRDARQGKAPERAAVPELPEGEDLVTWFRGGLAALVHELDVADPDAPAWTFVPGDRTCGFWIRRQPAETLVHRMDAEAAAGTPSAVDPTLAADAVAEVFDVLAPRMLSRSEGIRAAVVELAGTGRWALDGTEISRSELPPTVVVLGSAEQALRAVYGREPWSGVPANGDVPWLEELQKLLRF